MGLFDKFKNNDEKKLYSPIQGTRIPLEDVKDKVFSTKAMGDGVGIQSEEGKVYAPFDGEVVALFPTNHAIGLKRKDGVELLIHIGIDTVELNGKYFSSNVKQGQKVRTHDVLITYDQANISQEYDTTVMVIVTNANGKAFSITSESALTKETELFIFK